MDQGFEQRRHDDINERQCKGEVDQHELVFLIILLHLAVKAPGIAGQEMHSVHNGADFLLCRAPIFSFIGRPEGKIIFAVLALDYVLSLYCIEINDRTQLDRAGWRPDCQILEVFDIFPIFQSQADNHLYFFFGCRIAI